MRYHIKQIYTSILLSCVFALSFSACSPEKFLSRSELYIGKQEVNLDKQELTDEKTALINELLLQNSNPKFLGVWYTRQKRFYTMDTTFSPISKESNLYFLNKPKQALHSIKTLFYRRTAIPFSLLDSSQIQSQIQSVQLELFNNGYFYSNVDYEVFRQPKRRWREQLLNSQVTRTNSSKYKQQVNIQYDINLGRRIQLNTITFQLSEPEFIEILNLDTAKTYQSSELSLPKFYSAERIKRFRNKLVQQLNNKGFYDFSKDNIEVLADTNQNQQVNLLFKFTGKSSFNKYHIGTVTVLDGETSKSEDTIHFDNVKFVQGTEYVNHKQLRNILTIHEKKLYDANQIRLTTQRLNNISYYRFINSSVEKTIQNDSNFLNYTIYLSPSPRYRTTANVELNSQVGYNLLLNDNGTYFSPTVSITQRIQNIFHRAETHSLNVGFSLGLNFNNLSSRKLIGGSDFNVKYQIQFPDLIIPFINPEFKKLTKLPSTSILLEYRSIRRISTIPEESLELAFQNLNGKYGFTFYENEQKTHQVFPLSISFQFPDLNIDQSFISEFQRLTLENFILLGGEYQFIYNSDPIRRSNKQTIFRGQLENYGLINKGISEAFRIKNSFEFNNASITRYVKPELYLSHTRRFNQKHQELAGKLLMGAAIPLAKDEIVPFLKKYTLGGVNSIRAFPIYGLGPSNTTDTLSKESNISFSNVANIKLESSIEARYPLSSLMYLTTFIDAGLLWETNTTNLNNQFAWNNFSAGTGLGIHFDFDFFIFRLDLGLPLYNANSQLNIKELYAIQKPKARNAIGAAFRLINFNFGIGEAF